MRHFIRKIEYENLTLKEEKALLMQLISNLESSNKLKDSSPYTVSMPHQQLTQNTNPDSIDL